MVFIAYFDPDHPCAFVYMSYPPEKCEEEDGCSNESCNDEEFLQSGVPERITRMTRLVPDSFVFSGFSAN